MKRQGPEEFLAKTLGTAHNAYSRISLDRRCTNAILEEVLFFRISKGSRTMSSSQKVSDANFEAEVLQASGPVVVDFWAEWCGPCKAMSPLVDELATSMGEKVKVVKVNIDENPNAPTKYGVRGIPTFMVFKDGKLVDTKVGSMSKGQLSDWVSANI